MKLFKRSANSQHAPFYCRFAVKGKAYLWSTKTDDIKLARMRAKAYREAIISESYGITDKMKARGGSPTFGELLEMYDRLPLRAALDTKACNKASLLLVLAASGYREDSRVDVLTAKLALTYQSVRNAAGKPLTSTNARLRFARSLFSRAALNGYKAMGLVIRREWVDDFCSIGAMKEAEHLPEIPTPAQVESAMALVRPFPCVLRAFLLAAYAGLRSGEIQAAKRSWIEGDVLFVGGREFTAKSGKWRAVRMDSAVLEMLTGCGPHRLDDFIVADQPAKTVIRKLPELLKQAGFTSNKPVHSLRRLYGSRVATASGLFAAQHALGHQSPMTTSKHYARLLQLPAAVGITLVAVAATG